MGTCSNGSRPFNNEYWGRQKENVMGLTIHYRIKVPAIWTPITIRAKLGAARLFAKTLPVRKVSEIAEFHGQEADFQHVRDTGQEEKDAFFWAKLQAQRYLSSPWEPGSSCGQAASQMLVFTVRPAEGSEPMNIGVCEYDRHIWRARKDDCVPAWSLVFDKGNHYPESLKVIRTFQRRWQLRRLPKSKWAVSQRFGGAEKVPFYSYLAQASIQRGRYASHRRGYVNPFGLVTLRDRMEHEICFRFVGSTEEAETVFKSKDFQADLNRLAVGENHITPAAKGLWSSFVKTQYANDPSLGGWVNFIKAHLSVLAILEHMQGQGFNVEVSDEGHFWHTRDLAVLAKHIGDYDVLVAGMAGALKDAAEAQGMIAESAMDVASGRQNNHQKWEHYLHQSPRRNNGG